MKLSAPKKVSLNSRSKEFKVVVITRNFSGDAMVFKVLGS